MKVKRSFIHPYIKLSRFLNNYNIFVIVIIPPQNFNYFSTAVVKPSRITTSVDAVRSHGSVIHDLTMNLYPYLSTGGESEDEGVGSLDPALCDNALSAEELSTLQDAADATRLAARITDTPANIMDVDKFIEVRIQKWYI